MSSGYDPRWDDPRERDDESRDIEIHWFELGREPGSDPRDDDPRVHDEDVREATATRAIAIRVMYSWMASSCLADSNARSSWTAIIGTN